MYILELLDLSYHRSHRRVPHHLKHIIYQGFWMILIGCRTDGYWKSSGWIFSGFLVLRKGGLWRFLRRICDQTTLSLQATYGTPENYDTYVYETEIPFLNNIDVSSFSVSGISWFDNGHIPTDTAICWLPDWFLNREARRRRCVSTDVHLKVKEFSTSSYVDYLTYLSNYTRIFLSMATNRQWRGRAVSISNQRHEYSPIDWSIYLSIDWSINGQMKQTEGYIISNLYISMHYLTVLST